MAKIIIELTDLEICATSRENGWGRSINSHTITSKRFPVTLTIDEMNGHEFMGTMEWPEVDTVTQVQGFLDGERMIWSETEYLNGEDVVLYGLYVAQFKTPSEIEGDWMDPKHTIYPKGPNYGVPGASFALTRE